MDGAVLIVLVLVIYFLPGLVASMRSHPSANAIFLLNLFLGWTLLGWVIALVWSATGVPQPAAAPAPTYRSLDELYSYGGNEPVRVKCPDCAELVLPEAKVCKHCGRKLAQEVS